MREWLRSFFRLSWSMSLVGLQQVIHMFSPEELAVAQVSTAEGSTLTVGIVRAISNPVKAQSGVEHTGWSPMSDGPPAATAPPAQEAEEAKPPSTPQANTGWAPMSGSAPPSSPVQASGTTASPTQGENTAAAPAQGRSADSTQVAGTVHTGWSPMAGGPTGASTGGSAANEIQSGKLKTDRFLVLGEGLAAGMGNFTLSSDSQQWCFPTQMAKQMGTTCPQRLFQSPGIGNLVGFPSLPVRVPAPPQTTVIDPFPPGPVMNLSIAELTLQDALELQATQPLIHRDNSKLTSANLVWGLDAILHGEKSLLTLVQYAMQQRPTFTLVELGYYEALTAAVLGDPDLLPDIETFIFQFRDLLNRLDGTGSQILVATIPDPLDTAHFSSLETAANLLKVEPVFLTKSYSIGANDFLTLNGLNEIAFQLFSKSIQPLPDQSILAGETAQQIREGIREINTRLKDLAAQHGAVYDLAALFRKVAHEGYLAGTRRLTGDFLGGFYSLNGHYPGATGQAIIANDVLSLLNRTYGSNFPMIDLSTVMASDSVAAHRQPGGPAWPSSDLTKLLTPVQAAPSEKPVQAPRRHGPDSEANRAWAPLAPHDIALPLQLPPGLEQVLPLSKAASYFGDGIAPIDCKDPVSVQWGTCGNFIFGGLAMVDSHLSGSIRIKFSPPINNVTSFEVSYEGGFQGDDAVLVTPQQFKMPFQQSRVDQVPGTVSSGKLNLATGEVFDLTIYARYRSTALVALVGVNPTFPKQPLAFPGQYGAASAQFEQRPDGMLDFTFYGSTFVPLGKDISWPLNFVGPSGQFATIPAVGTVMHPHLQLSTKEPEGGGADISADIPFNSVQEYTLFTHNSAFGDLFTLNVAELGGPAKGRSHLLGRLQIQFGGRTGNSVPVAIWALPPGGEMEPMPPSPITQMFPAPLSAGPQGFNEDLRFPLRTYPLDTLSIIDDPFDISVGSIDLSTGKSLNQIYHRGFINQDLIYALLRVEPRTPKGSFYFQGPAVLLKDERGQQVFRFRGLTHLPYPEGFSFPKPDFAMPFVAGSNSALDPYLWFHAIQSKPTGRLIISEGSAQEERASSGDLFSYRYSIPSQPDRHNAVFEYENHTQQGQFRMHSLVWVDFANSATQESSREDYDTVTFAGYGIWTKGGTSTLQLAAVQISKSSTKPFVGIQISSGDVSNVNTKPQEEANALP
jgi:hypothetical protein